MSDPLADLATVVANTRDADVILYAGSFWYENDLKVLRSIKVLSKRKNVFFMLCTYGGLPDVGYRIARFLRHEYETGKIILFVPGDCMSAGSLIAFAADEIVMTDEAEIGPIDIQVRDKEEVGEMASGLTPMQALDALREESGNLFRELFRKLRKESRFATRLAATVASQIVIGLLRPMYSQLDPLRLAENRRAVNIVSEYGSRIKSSNVKEGTIAKLVVSYPSHGFVIDREEVAELFNVVNAASPDEIKLAEAVSDIMKIAVEKDGEALVRVLSNGKPGDAAPILKVG